jgi:hypothetical protein
MEPDLTDHARSFKSQVDEKKWGKKKSASNLTETRMIKISHVLGFELNNKLVKIIRSAPYMIQAVNSSLWC